MSKLLNFIHYCNKTQVFKLIMFTLKNYVKTKYKFYKYV